MFSIQVENIPKGFVKKNHKNIPTTPILKPEFEWLKNYLNPNRPHIEKENNNTGSKQSLSKKVTIRKLLKTKPKAPLYENNQNINNMNVSNILSDPKYGILTKNTVVKNIELTQAKEVFILNLKQEMRNKRYSCEISRQPKKQVQSLNSRPHLPKVTKTKCIKEFDINTIDPWQIQERNQSDIVNYKFI